MRSVLKIGPVAVLLQDFLNSKMLFQTWHWKLDSFLCDASDVCDHSIAITSNTKENFDVEIEETPYLEDTIAGFFSICVQSYKDGYLYRYIRRSKNISYFSYFVNKEWNAISLLEDKTETMGQYAFEHLAFIIPYCMLNYNVLTLHGVLMEYNGQGIIISADSGVGKTTHARLWKRYKNAFVINGDKAACYLKEGVWTGFGMPWCGSSGEYMNREVPIKAIVFLERDDSNHVENLSMKEGFIRLMHHALYPAWEEHLSEKAIDLIGEMVEGIPAYRLFCRPDEDAVNVLEHHLFR